MIETSEILIRLSLGALCGAIIGIERERKEWAAGMRTHMMVSVGAALFMLVSSYGFNEVLGNDKIVLDPSRVAAQVVSGIGFLGAGTIIFLRQGVIRGLTTASGLWTVAGIGLAIGGGMYIAGIATTVIAIIILWVLQPLEAFVYSRSRWKTLTITTYKSKESSQIMDLILSNIETSVKSFEIEMVDDGGAELTVRTNSLNDLKRVVALLNDHPAIKSIHWRE